MDMKKMYQQPYTDLLTVETAILCASGGVSNFSNGSLQNIGKGSGEW
jgi:hypothetical protein